MLGRFPWWRHLAVVIVVLLGGGLAVARKIGPSRDESFDSKQIVVSPTGGDGLRVREVVDEDFGSEERHGYERLIPEDFGVPTDVEASSPDAPDTLSVRPAPRDGWTRIRIGDPDETVTGQHRYVLEYTYPATGISGGQLALDIIGADEDLRTAQFEVVVTGMELADPTCNVGSVFAVDGCELERDGDVYRAVFEPLEPGDGITIGGTVIAFTDPVDVEVPPLPARHDDPRWLLAGLIVVLGAGAAGAVLVWARRKGRNEVFSGGAADAAFGAPGTTLVPDDKMDELATTEFVPPTGIRPWQGSVVLRESFDNDTISAWFSGLAAADVLAMGPADDTLRLAPGPAWEAATHDDAAILTTMFAGRSEVTLGSYDASFASAWKKVGTRQQEILDGAGWWTGRAPQLNEGGGVVVFVVLGLWLALLGAGSFLPMLVDRIRSPWVGVPVMVSLAAITAYLSYKFMLRSRTAVGSAIAIRTESFRRFLAASEGRHVDWAWQHGVLREYSAWAVALGCADAWGRALATSHVPPDQSARMTTPLLVSSMRSSFNSAHTAPSTSSGSGGGFSSGGFSGGFSGGGGGGGSSGSW